MGKGLGFSDNNEEKGLGARKTGNKRLSGTARGVAPGFNNTPRSIS